MALPVGLVAALRGICGERWVREAGELAGLDPGFHPDNLKAGAAVYPASVAEVQAVVRLCAGHGVGLVPQGGRTGLAGAATSLPGQVIVSLARFDRIEDVSPASATALVGAGVTLEALQQAAAGHGLTPGIDIAARGSATVGGMISTNAGGMEAFRLGVMRQRVVGLEAVLADGSVVSDLKRVGKANEGLDVKQLLIGAEGTLGIVTRAVIRLDRLWTATATAMVACTGAAAAVAALRMMARPGGEAALLRAEILWRDYVRVTAQGLGLERLAEFADAPVYVLFETGADDEEEARAGLEVGLARCLEAELVLDAVIAQSGREAAEMWRIREESWTAERLFPGGLWYDVSVPLDRLDAYVAGVLTGVGAIDPAIVVFCFGHLGDGNLHITVTTGADMGARKAAVDEAVFGGLAEAGGSFSAEHGIGTEKRAALARHGDPGKLAAMRAVKQALDPAGIMNPGKVY